MNLSINSSLTQNNSKNHNNISFSAANNWYNRWRYDAQEDWLYDILSRLSKEDRKAITERYGGPKCASAMEIFVENLKGILYPVTKFFNTKTCIKFTELPHEYPYAVREEFYSDGSMKIMKYGARNELVYMKELNKDKILTRSVEYNWNYGDYTVKIYGENNQIIKEYSVKYPYYPRLGDT